MPIILNIETATDICSVCISKSDEILIIKEADKDYSHTAKITLLIERCCAETEMSLKQLDAVAVSKGPGSYTSLRVGASTAKGICYALDKPLLAIDTLESIAHASSKDGKENFLYAPMIDARRMEVYSSLFDKDMNRIEETQAKIIDERSFQKYFEKGFTIVFSGNGATKCQNVIKSPKAIFSSEVCSAANLVPLSFQAYQRKSFSDLAYFSPLYFKSPNITIPRKTL
jgi:tRNA threonylcarbamoyladenosine biosynthesis protein TsaB